MYLNIIQLQIDKTLNLNVDIVDNYMANLTDDKSTGEILKQDSEDCNAMAVRFVNIYITWSNR